MAGGVAAVSGLAGRYASALFELADERKQLDALAEELRAFKDTIAESEDLRRLIRSPLYRRDQQSAAMASILEKAGAGDLARRFILVVAAVKRAAGGAPADRRGPLFLPLIFFSEGFF